MMKGGDQGEAGTAGSGTANGYARGQPTRLSGSGGEASEQRPASASHVGRVSASQNIRVVSNPRRDDLLAAEGRALAGSRESGANPAPPATRPSRA